MDDFKKNKQKNQRKTLLIIFIGLLIIGIGFFIANFNINFDKDNNVQKNIAEDYFENNRQKFEFENFYVYLQEGKYLIASNDNTSSFYGNYLIFENDENYKVCCYYDTHNTSTDIEFFNENKLKPAFEFELSSDKKSLSPITDFSKFNFDELIF